MPVIHALDAANSAEPATDSVEKNPFALDMVVGELHVLLPAVLPLNNVKVKCLLYNKWIIARNLSIYMTIEIKLPLLPISYKLTKIK